MTTHTGRAHRLTYGAIAALVTFAVLASCGNEANTFDGTTGDNAQTLLAQADDTWTDMIDDPVEQGTLTVADGSQCFMQEHTTSDDGLAPRLFCGPARSITESQGAPAWYTLPLSITQHDDGLAFELTSDEFENTDVDTTTLIRPDGDEPADATDLPEPQPPRTDLRDAAMLTDPASLAIDVPFDQLDQPARLITPAATISIDGIGHPELIPASVAGQPGDDAPERDGRVFRPAEGQIVTVWKLSIDTPATPTPGYDVDDTAHTDIELAVGAGQRTIPIDAEFSDDDGATIECTGWRCQDDATGQHILFTTTTADKLTLITTVDGHQQTLDLTSGDLSSDVSQVAYNHGTHHIDTAANWGEVTDVVRTEKQLEAEFGTAASDLTRGGATYTYGGTINNAYLTPFELAHGWAPAGKAWLVIPIENDPAHTNGPWKADINHEASWTLTTPEETIHHTGGGSPRVAVFLVNDDFTTGEFIYRPAGVLSQSYPETIYPFTAAKPLSLDITIS